MKSPVLLVAIVLCMVALVMPAVMAADLNIVGQHRDGSTFKLMENGGYLYVGNGGTLSIYDVSTQAKKQALDQDYEQQPLNYYREVNRSISSKTTIRGMTINGTLMLVTSESEGIFINITDPTKPVELSRVQKPFTANFDKGSTIIGNYAYISESTKGILTYNIADPRNPVYLGYDIGTHSVFTQVVDGNYLITGSESFTGVTVFDISNPADPVYFSTITLKSGTHSAHGIALKNHVLYVSENYASYGGGLWAVNISNINSPVVTSFYNGSILSTSQDARGVDCHVDGNYLYVSIRYYGYMVYDISTPDTPAFVAQFPTVKPDFVHAGTTVSGMSIAGYTEGIWHSNNTVYSAMDTFGFTIVNDTVKTSPSLLAHFNTPSAPNGLLAVNDTIIISGRNGGVWTVNVSDKTTPRVIGFSFTGGRAEPAKIDNGIVFVPASWAEVSAFSLNNSYNLPAKLYHYGGLGVSSLFVDNHHHLFTSYKAYDVTDPANPIVLGPMNQTSTYGAIESNNGAPGFAQLNDHTLVVTATSAFTSYGESRGLFFYNTTNASHITMDSSWRAGDAYSMGIAVKGNYVIAQNFNASSPYGYHVEIIDAADTFHPTLVTYFTPKTGADSGIAEGYYNILIDERNPNVMYLASGTTNPSIVEYDITDITNPVRIEALDLTGRQYVADYENGYIYTGSYNNGFYIVTGNATTYTTPTPTSTPTATPTTTATPTPTPTPGPQPTMAPRPSSWINPCAYQMPYFDQGSTGTCSGASGAYNYGIHHCMEEGLQPTYVQPSVTNGQSTTYQTHNIDYTIYPAWWPSSRSLYANYISSGTSNVTEWDTAMAAGANLESDWISPENTAATTYYTPQTKSYLDAHKMTPPRAFTTIDAGTATSLHTLREKWELLKEDVYRSGSGAMVIPTYSNYGSSNGTYWTYPSGSYIDHHYLAVVGYNDTQDVVYVMNSWRDGHPSHGKIEAISYSYWQYATNDNRKVNATIPWW